MVVAKNSAIAKEATQVKDEPEFKRSKSDKTKLKVAFWWCAVKAGLMFVAFLALMAGMSSTIPGEMQVLASSLFCSVALGGAISEFILKMSKGESKNTTGFGILVLVLYSLVAGILMLTCEKDK